MEMGSANNIWMRVTPMPYGRRERKENNETEKEREVEMARRKALRC